jgi:glycosyltransferase involved in cell wall biosynthesis
VRIAWLTPFAARSAIGEFSDHVGAALAARGRTDIDIWTADPPPWRPSELPVVAFAPGDQALAALGHYDVVVHNIGNHPGFHGAILAVSQRHPGIVILHDRVLHHMLVALWQRDADTFASVYVARMFAHYGAAGAAAAREALVGVRPPLWPDADALARFPLDREAALGAIGVVTHARSHAARLSAEWPGPVVALPFPSYRRVVEETRAAAAGPPPPRSDGRLQLTTFGHIVENKCLDRVIGILAADAGLAARVHYSIAGEADDAYATQLRRLLDAAPHVSAELLGWLDDADLDRLLTATDVFVNLRHPTTESGSASLARQLAYGRPILCFDAGASSELREGAVARVPAPDFDAAAAELAQLVADPARRAALGTAARGAALENTEERYARELRAFIAATGDRTAPARSAAAVLATLPGRLARLLAPPMRSRRRDHPPRGVA